MTMGISVILPTFNEEKYIGQCIESVQAELAHLNECPYEIIVVDNMSTDNTAKVVARYNVTYMLSTKKGSPSATRNIGAKASTFDILCFIDGDCLVTSNWFHQVLNVFSNKDVAAYGGSALSPTTGNWIETTWAPTETKEFYSEFALLAGANFSIRKSVFNQLNGFDENLETAEDDDLSKRVLRQGHKIISENKHPVIHLGYPQSLASIYKKQLWHSKSQIKAHGYFGDKMVLLTCIWIFSFFSSLIILLLSMPIIASIISIPFFAAPMLVAHKRLERFKHKGLKTYLRAYVICWPFLLGRAVGLLREALHIS